MAGPADDRERWNRNAGFWDEQMGEAGNRFHLELVRPAVERLLGDVVGRRVLDVACGNGLFARRLASRGANVLAVDVSEAMVERARGHAVPTPGAIEYRLLDAADPAAVAALGESAFDAIVCNMALMDMADIEPLACAAPRLLRDRGRLVFSITHPCFNTLGVRFVAEHEEVAGDLVWRRGVLVTRYATAASGEGIAISGQPVTQRYYERPLNLLLRPFLDAGLVLDGLEEPAFPADVAPDALRWEGFPEIPPVLVCRLRPDGR
jgi:SAM-dependent methyltransferase